MRGSLLALLLLLVGCPSERADDDDAAGDDDTSDVGDDDDSIADHLSLDALVTAFSTETDPEVLDALLMEVGWQRRWPLEEDGRWLFATRWEAAATLSLVGDLNGWDPASTPANGSPTGAHWWVVVEGASFTGPAAGSRVKWTDATTWAAGSENTAYLWDENGRFGYVAPPTNAPWAEQFPDLTSEAMPIPRTVRVLLPAGFVPGSAAAAASRTLLMHDGQNLFDPGAFAGGWGMDSFLAAPPWQDVVLVGVDNASDRLDAYSHVADDVFGDGTSFGGRADDYLALLDQSVLPFVRDRYGVVAEGNSLMLAGSSMGGLVTLYAARQWDDFGCAAALSPTLGFGSITADGTNALVNLWPASPGHGAVPIFLYNGGGEPTPCVDSDGDGVVEGSAGQDNYCVTLQFRDMLASQGYVYETDLWHWHEPGAQHTESAWRAQVDRMLQACAASGWVAP